MYYTYTGVKSKEIDLCNVKLLQQTALLGFSLYHADTCRFTYLVTLCLRCFVSVFVSVISLSIIIIIIIIVTII